MILVRCCILLVVIQKSSLNEYDIVKNIFVGYDKDVRPSINGEPTIINISPDLTWILDVDEKQETLLYRQWLPLLWNDPFLRWDPDAFGGTKKIYIPATRVWRPDISIKNANRIIHIIPPEEVYAEIDHSGNVTVEFLQDVYIHCAFDMFLFPFDTQTCQTRYGSWAYPIQEVIVQNLVPQFALELDTEHPEWKITESLKHVGSDMSLYAYFQGHGIHNRTFKNMQYNITIKREPMFYIMTVALPILGITGLCIIGVFTPNNSQGVREEKVTLGLTTLLAMAMFLNIITGDMPKSEGTPVFGRFIIGQILFAGLATAVSAITMYLHELSFSNRWTFPEWNRPKHSLTSLESKENEQQDDGKEIIEKWLEEKRRERNNQKKWTIFFDRVDLFCLVAFLSAYFLIAFDRYRHVMKLIVK